ncbi:putative reverse transcriptase domain-containing protein [Tanacetum coccineum]
MERVFLSPKGSGGGRGVKEKIGGSVDVSAKVNNGVDEGTTTSSNLAMNTQNPTDNAATNVVISPMGPISSAPTSYAKLVTESIRAISERFANMAYGFFLGKRVTYPIVANYVRNNWGKYGLVKSTLNSSTRLFFLQFSSMDSLDSMLENGSWFIGNNPLILKKLNPDVNLLKEDVVNVPVQVKLHGVPVTTFSEDGLSTIATKLDTTLMLDSYTYDISMQSWGRSSYARAMIELRANMELKDTTMMVMPKLFEYE